MQHRNNSYDLLRLLLATFVLISHSYFLLDVSYSDIGLFLNNQTYLGEIGLLGFFSLSGYLITKSFTQTSNGIRFFTNRVLRIFPGFWMCLLVTAFVIAPAIFYLNTRSFKGFPLMDYWGAVSYIRANFLLKINQIGIGDLLDTAKVKNINGSLWTLRYEFICYAATYVLGVLTVLQRKKMTLALAVAVYSVYVFQITGLFGSSNEFLSYPFLKLLVAYFTGTLFFHHRETIFKSKRTFLFLLISSTVLFAIIGKLTVILPITIGLILLILFGSFKLSLKQDYSYGIYIYSFPVQQLLFIYNREMSLPVHILLSLMITTVFAYLSFNLVENPFISLKSKTRKISPAYSQSGENIPPLK